MRQGNFMQGRALAHQVRKLMPAPKAKSKQGSTRHKAAGKFELVVNVDRDR